MSKTLPVAALVLNALVWGISWWPFKQLQAAGLHPLWATAVMFGIATLVLLVWRRGAVRSTLGHPGLWGLALAAGLTNISFNWAVTAGDVVRVVLLFYLMPAWSVLLAWWLLGEKPTALRLAQLALAMAGVALVLLPPDGTWQRLATGFGLTDALAIAGGAGFALTNILLRRLHKAPDDARALAMFAGCLATALVGASMGTWASAWPGVPAPTLPWVALVCGMALLFLAGNYGLQYGAARLAAGTTALVMLSEVIFASASSVLLGQAQLTWPVVVGGVLILTGALLSIRQTSANSTTP